MYAARRRRHRQVPRKFRLAITICVLAALIICIVLFARGCMREKNDEVVDPSNVESKVNPVSDKDLDEAPDGDETEADLEDQQEQGAPADGSIFQQTPVSTAKPGGRSVTIRSIGDVVIDTDLLAAAKTQDGYDFRPNFQYAAAAMANADYTVLNVDGPMGGKAGRSGYYGYPQFNTPPHLLNALAEVGVDMLTLSNNHALDSFFDGLKAQIDNVESVGLDHIGAYRTQEEYDAPCIKTLNGIDIGFLNYTISLNTMERHSDPDALVYGLRTTGKSNAQEDIAKLKAAGAEVIVVYMHWGDEYKAPTQSQKTMAQKLASYGADVIVGGHPHVVQPCEWISTTGESGAERKTLALYSMGNFLTNHRHDKAAYTDSGIIFEFTLRANDATGEIEVTDPKYIPVYVWRFGSNDQYEYRVLPIGDYIDNPPQGMDEENINRMKEALTEIQGHIGDVAQIQRN